MFFQVFLSPGTNHPGRIGGDVKYIEGGKGAKSDEEVLKCIFGGLPLNTDRYWEKLLWMFKTPCNWFC